MDNESRPPQSDNPFSPPPFPPDLPPAGRSTSYQVMADAVGFVPNARKRDNLIQGVAVLAGLVIGAPMGMVLIPTLDPEIPVGAGGAMGAVLGLIAGAFVGGFAVMIRGFIRTANG